MTEVDQSFFGTGGFSVISSWLCSASPAEVLSLALLPDNVLVLGPGAEGMISATNSKSYPFISP